MYVDVEQSRSRFIAYTYHVQLRRTRGNKHSWIHTGWYSVHPMDYPVRPFYRYTV